MTMEPTTTLADALLDDLNDLLDSDDDEVDSNKSLSDAGGYDESDEKLSPAEETTMKDEESSRKLDKSVKKSRFLESTNLQRHLETISNLETNQQYLSLPKKEREREDHRLVVQSNKHLANLADEVVRAHGELAIAYKPKFPELEELLPNYIQCFHHQLKEFFLILDNCVQMPLVYLVFETHLLLHKHYHFFSLRHFF